MQLTMIKFFNPADYLPCKNCSHSKKLHITNSTLPRCKVTGCQCSTYKGYLGWLSFIWWMRSEGLILIVI
jgi:hypothetical protein